VGNEKRRRGGYGNRRTEWAAGRNEGPHVDVSSFSWCSCCEERFLVAMNLLRSIDSLTVFSLCVCARGLVFSVGVAARVGVRRYWIDLASMTNVYMAWSKCPDLYPQRTTFAQARSRWQCNRLPAFFPYGGKRFLVDLIQHKSWRLLRVGRSPVYSKTNIATRMPSAGTTGITPHCRWLRMVRS
jgi:hypothetical protein